MGRRAQKVRSPDVRGRRKGLPAGWLRSPWLLALLIIVATIAAYSNSLRSAFVFDDVYDIVQNKSIQRLWPLGPVFAANLNGTTALRTRPVVNLTFAVNYALGALDPLVYHVTNLAVHILAALTLFGIVRRTLLLPLFRDNLGPAAAATAALTVALIWSLHPMQTQAVTYTVQRYESMMGLFYLLAVYCTLRGDSSPRALWWSAAAVASCLLALGCKEVAISIPLTVLLYDRAFLAGSFREAWRRRWPMYLGFTACWAVFAIWMRLEARRTWAGYELPVSWLEYARTQPGVILHYLRLAVWPQPLVLDYDWPVAHTVGEILPGTLVVGILALATIYGLVRHPAWGFLGAWFFLILAPTSSIMPLADIAFIHRMYLPLAAVVTALAACGFLMGRWLVQRGKISWFTCRLWAGGLVACASAVLGFLTYQRNKDFVSDLSIWQDTVAKAPRNARAHNNLALALAGSGQVEAAMEQYREALKLDPNYAEVHNNYGLALAAHNELRDAVTHFQWALEIEPSFSDACNNLAVAEANLGETDAAIDHFQRALAINPTNAEAQNNLGGLLASRGEVDAAITHYRAALELNPNYAAARQNLDSALKQKLKARPSGVR
jgi:protein O-mannosyl-transferase